MSPVTTEVFWIETPQGRLFARRWFATPNVSDKPVIVLFHDSLGSVELWRDFPQQLCEATGLDVVAYDRLGFGQSAPYPGHLPLTFVQDEAERFFPQLREALGIERFIAFGHSVGGAMASHCAAYNPRDCLALITESAQAFVEDRTLQGIRTAKQQFQAPGQLERLGKYHGDKAQWVLDAWTETWLSAAFSNWTLKHSVGSVHCPLLALHGDLDEYGSVLHPQRIAALAGDRGEAVILEGCHHVPHREDSARVLAKVIDYLGRIG
ncbi:MULTISPECIES: alpha/beta hydrolase [unclassified Pseudomonas]|uniref:alpha/beta hydrolase n=1 Tax=unclassified Pseudomonas TaxID=196821 RepID=UPI0021C58FD5|nr:MULTISPECIES: alpha/beta hydrolase [unclassified Pseudomonas]MCU1732260.1 alpha/beta hydrolase [Pseudomonas sp. 20P_3.2_Bac4]MCU1745219.1 alpha/beta hydrolase [Pseudomonas sp. 20P_3.2_Bac5]